MTTNITVPMSRTARVNRAATYNKPKRQNPKNAPPRERPGRRKKRKRRSNLILHYFLILFILITTAIVLSLTVFFKIESISVNFVQAQTVQEEALHSGEEGAQAQVSSQQSDEMLYNTADNPSDEAPDDESEPRYTQNEIEAALGIEPGDNLFLADLDTARAKLIEQFAYIEDVKLTRAYPPEIQVLITYAEPIAGFGDGGDEYTLMSAQGRILEHDAPLPDGVLPVMGWQPSKDLEVGDYVGKPPEEEDPEAEAEAALTREVLLMMGYIVQALEVSGLEAQEVDLSDRYNIVIRHSPDIVIEFGSEGDLIYKMELVKKVIDTQLEQNFVGILYAEQKGKVWADPQDAPPVDYGIPDHYVFDELTGTYIDPTISSWAGNITVDDQSGAQESTQQDDLDEG